MSKALKKRGFSFVGPTIVYAFMQAVGMVNDHLVSCFRYDEVKALTSTNQHLDDPQFPQIPYRRGVSGVPTAVIRGTGIRVQAVAIAYKQWEMSASAIAEQYGLSVKQIEEALAFFAAHRAEIKNQIALEEQLVIELNG
jgi:uncharacterized protein (DUF433 family)